MLLNASAINKTLIVITAILISANSIVLYLKFGLGMKNIDSLVELFNLDIERNIPTFYSTLLLLISASLLMVITKHVKANSRDHLLQWTALTIGFLFLSYDEAFSLHERLVAPMREIIGMKSLGVFHFAWVVVALIILPFLGLFFLRFLLSLPATWRKRFLLAGTIYLGGAVGMELIGGWYVERVYRDGFYYILATIEESLEMIGVIIFIDALIKVCVDKEITIRFTK